MCVKAKEQNKYEDMLTLPYPMPSVRPRMSILDRAAQFSPFSALNGYEEAVQETARLTERRVEREEKECSLS